MTLPALDTARLDLIASGRPYRISDDLSEDGKTLHQQLVQMKHESDHWVLVVSEERIKRNVWVVVVDHYFGSGPRTSVTCLPLSDGRLAVCTWSDPVPSRS